MSGARRKSKHPQKWEESLSPDDQLPSSFEGNGTLLSDEYKGDQKYKNEYINAYSASTSKPFPLHSNILDNKDDKLIRKLKLKTNSRKRSVEGSSDDEEIERKVSGTNEGEMTVLDVLQGFRQGLIAECRACSIQLKDWSSTVSHIRSHRLVFIPSCAKDIGGSAYKQPSTCLLCQKVCQNLSVLALHVHSEHSLTKTPYLCPFCGQVFPSSSLIQKHIDIRVVCMKCPVCSAPYDQEYELYAHLSDCLPTFHPHLKSLTCHVCSERILMNSLADHMINHSVEGHEVRLPKHRRKSDSSSRPRKVASSSQDSEPNLFLCEICDRRFNCFDNFRRHLFDHTETKMYCPLCYLKGFDRVDFIVRHLMLRCPRRSKEQFEFGSVISIIGKEQKQNFLQVLKEIHPLKPFREGLLTWASIPLVQELLKEIEQLRKGDVPISSGLTDIDLLLWLNDFEKEMHKQRSQNSESAKQKTTGLDLADGSSYTQMATRPATVHETNRLNSSSMHQLEHKSSLEEIRKTCPGVTLLHDVDVKRLKPLYDEAMASLETDALASRMRKESFTSNDFLRLEWEAQYLREKEPFYLPPDETIRSFSPLRKKPPASTDASASAVAPETLKRIYDDLKELQEEQPAIPPSPLIDQTRLNSLLQEAKEC